MTKARDIATLTKDNWLKEILREVPNYDRNSYFSSIKKFKVYDYFASKMAKC